MSNSHLNANPAMSMEISLKPIPRKHRRTYRTKCQSNGNQLKERKLKINQDLDSKK
jgi:hypothetical protein